MNITKVKYIYFVGIGGIGMSAIARFLNHNNKFVAGYDRSETVLTKKLQEENIEIKYTDEIKNIPQQIVENKAESIIIYTPAIKENSILNFFREKKYDIKKRSEVLGLITKNGNTIAVAGTHGKTSVSSMTAHLFYQSKEKCNAFLGGITQNYNSNLLLSENNNNFIVEADEFDRSFLQLAPQTAIITSIDPDHLDIYKNFDNLKKAFNQFATQIKENGKLIINKDVRELISDKINAEIYTYSLNEKADFYASEIELKNGLYHFNINISAEKIKNIKLGVYGITNVENSLAAFAAAWINNISAEEIRKGLASFKGIKRRFELYTEPTAKTVYIDDYAHHPKEIDATLESIRKIYPDRKITVVFQPHLFSRTQDFADEFAESLSKADELILLEIYPAREKPIEGVNSKMILDKVKIKNKQICLKEQIMKLLQTKKIDILITMGAGNIDQHLPEISEYITSLNKR